ncbi:MAG: hypothetical protein ACUVWZ_07805 [Anaerolineae bacterium]|mgnify:CR=1 FL=1
MERRGWGLGCVIAWLGLILGCCLLPYLISSIYSIVTAVLQVPAVPEWLWGDWLSTIVEVDSPAYMVLAEGPICCVGTIALFILVLGLVLMISGMVPAGPSSEEELPEG